MQTTPGYDPVDDPFFKLLLWMRNIVILCAWLVAAIFIGIIFAHLSTISAEAEQYRKSTYCLYMTGCRKMVEAEIMDRYTSIDTGQYSRARFKAWKYPIIQFYSITVKFASGETYNIFLYPHLNINVNQFGVNNIYFPDPQTEDETMAEASFTKGQKVKLEIWKNKPSIIYSAYVFGAPRLTGTNEYALPTQDNPIVNELFQQQRWVLAIVCLIIIPIILSRTTILKMLNTDVDKIVEEQPKIYP